MAGMCERSDASRVLDALSAGPATTSEIAVELGMPVRIACAHLGNLRSRGHVAATRFPTGNRRVRNLWVRVKEAR